MNEYKGLETIATMVAVRIKKQYPELEDKVCGQLAKDFVIDLLRNFGEKVIKEFEQGGKND